MVQVGGSAFWCIGVLWGLAALTSLFVCLRLYTRLKVVDAYGMDDHFFNTAFAMLVIYCVLITVAAHYGFGQDLEAIGSQKTITKAILWEAAGQTVVVLAVWVSKTSLAIFLIRLTSSPRQQLAIMGPSVALGLVIIASLVSYWFDCRPLAFLWDRSIPGGYCLAVTNYISLAAGCFSVLLDLWYAAFPWYMLWGVQMPRREKLLIQISLSLGVLAAACGVERALQLKTLISAEYLKDTAPLIVWHAAELSTTMVCIGIPVCRPLYGSWMGRIVSTAGKRRGESDGSALDGVYTMHTIGGSEFNKNMGKRGQQEDGRKSAMVLRDDIPVSNPNRVVIKSARNAHSANTSEESILRAESGLATRVSVDDAAPAEPNSKGIRVTTAFGVDR